MNLKTLTEKVAEIISDYEGDGSNPIDSKHIHTWINQFEESDRVFLLQELVHLFQQCYFSKEKTIDCLFKGIKYFARKYGYRDEVSFLLESKYISTQKEDKSQTEILRLFYESLPLKFGIEERFIGSSAKKFAIYFDDILATGNTTVNEIENFLKTEKADYIKRLVNDEFKLLIQNVCCHSWGKSNSKYRFKMIFGDDVLRRIVFYANYSIENNPNDFKRRFNHAYPIDKEMGIVKKYLASIDTGEFDKYVEFAFRPTKEPKKETFFSSPENRNRYEYILLTKGIEILESVKKLNSPMRPLGYTVKSHRTFGLGTHFFTWRNVPNTAPLVFWWKSKTWYPLFPVKNRG
ncbi:MAG: hypothetical protein AAGG68_14860 [Bacteroidota bacterium]